MLSRSAQNFASRAPASQVIRDGKRNGSVNWLATENFVSASASLARSKSDSLRPGAGCPTNISCAFHALVRSSHASLRNREAQFSSDTRRAARSSSLWKFPGLAETSKAPSHFPGLSCIQCSAKRAPKEYPANQHGPSTAGGATDAAPVEKRSGKIHSTSDRDAARTACQSLPLPRKPCSAMTADFTTQNAAEA